MAKPPYHKTKVIKGGKAHDRRATDLPMHAHVAVAEVDDPFAIPEGAVRVPAGRGGHGAEWRAGGGQKIVVVRSIRSDPLAWMQAHNQIDTAAYRAARHWQGLYARSSIGRIQSVDTTKEPVDGGKLPEMLSDDQKGAMRTLRHIEASLGELRHAVIYDVLAVEMFIAQSAEQRGIGKRRASRLFHAGLDVLADEFGYSGTSVPRVQKKRTLSFDKPYISR